MLDDTIQLLLTMPIFPSAISAWDVLNSNLLLAVIAAVFTAIFKKDVDDRRELEAARSMSFVAREDLEALEMGGKKANFAPAAEIIGEFKSGIEVVVENADKRHQRTYGRIPRYDYAPLVQALGERDIGDKESELLQRAFEIYKPYKSGRRDVPDDVLKELTDIKKKLGKLKFPSEGLVRQ